MRWWAGRSRPSLVSCVHLQRHRRTAGPARARRRCGCLLGSVCARAQSVRCVAHPYMLRAAATKLTDSVPAPPSLLRRTRCPNLSWQLARSGGETCCRGEVKGQATAARAAQYIVFFDKDGAANVRGASGFLRQELTLVTALARSCEWSSMPPTRPPSSFRSHHQQSPRSWEMRALTHS